ncbi:hypothetical protein DSO57_1001795 [Entomophthora muscae]|uniref:Uncharacterized protein n=1 Tax=Entomophthora muscae TaxID=34485 RepID=A0ACC2U7E2_9FUNG|nr:hypothetical protein DSO57_1001795 [Entomophthora muscae]
MGASVLFALRHAIAAARQDNGITAPLSIPSPATAEIIRLACQDKLVKAAETLPFHGTEIPWAVRP